MARARNLKPGFFQNEILAECDPLARILFAGLWCIADREGRLEDRPRKIRAELLPYDDVNVDDLLNQLSEHRFIRRYEIDGGRYIQVINFLKHQDPHYKEKASIFPPPPDHTDSGKTPGGVSEDVRQKVFARDNHTCVRCGSKENLSIDHVIPRSKGGSHDESNLQTLCRSCNSAKNNRQAKEDLTTNSNDDRPTIDQPSTNGQSSVVVTSPLIPSSLIPSSKEKHLARSCEKPRSSKPDDDSPIVLAIPTVGPVGETPVRESLVCRLRDGFPGLDVEAELRKAKLWCESNPAKRKTPRGLPKFIFAWMNKAQNGGGQRRHGASSFVPEERL